MCDVPHPELGATPAGAVIGRMMKARNAISAAVAASRGELRRLDGVADIERPLHEKAPACRLRDGPRGNTWPAHGFRLVNRRPVDAGIGALP
jgi:hypothetical protein